MHQGRVHSTRPVLAYATIMKYVAVLSFAICGISGQLDSCDQVAGGPGNGKDTYRVCVTDTQLQLEFQSVDAFPINTLSETIVT